MSGKRRGPMVGARYLMGEILTDGIPFLLQKEKIMIPNTFFNSKKGSFTFSIFRSPRKNRSLVIWLRKKNFRTAGSVWSLNGAPNDFRPEKRIKETADWFTI